MIIKKPNKKINPTAKDAAAYLKRYVAKKGKLVAD